MLNTDFYGKTWYDKEKGKYVLNNMWINLEKNQFNRLLNLPYATGESYAFFFPEKKLLIMKGNTQKF